MQRTLPTPTRLSYGRCDNSGSLAMFTAVPPRLAARPQASLSLLEQRRLLTIQPRAFVWCSRVVLSLIGIEALCFSWTSQPPYRAYRHNADSTMTSA